MTEQEYQSSEHFISSLCDEFRKHNHIPPEVCTNLKVRRGLRNADGTGVLAGVTLIGNVRGYTVVDDERKPIPGKLIYRGIDVEDIVDGILKDDRFGYEEIAYLLLFGQLPQCRAAANLQRPAPRDAHPAEKLHRGHDYQDSEPGHYE